MQICPAYQLSGLSVLICIKLIKLYKNEIIQKIRAKRESGLTAVRLKRDPPVYNHAQGDSFAAAILSLNHRGINTGESISVSIKVVIACTKGFS